VAKLAPGLALAAGVALAALALEAGLRTGLGWSLPAMVLALLVGMAASRLAEHPAALPGVTYAVKKLLRIAIALLGLRVSLGDIAALGLPAAALVVASMALTVVAAIWLARRLGLDDGYGALAGAANAVCGASATLAAATVVPAYPRKAADVAFTVVMANAVSTAVMLAYPPLGAALGLSPQTMGLFFGATIHDMAQVVGAGYAVSEPVGATSVVVKLFRVFLLLPVVLAIGWWFASRGAHAGEAKVPVPVFAIVFVVLALLNSAMAYLPALQPLYAPVKAALAYVSTAGLLLAIAALGLGTSVKAVLETGWRHAAVFLGATVVILAAVLAGLAVL
jgi:uncharacterized integral membrane protein (TIGR00698 family)